jgi:hypothetical protein
MLLVERLSSRVVLLICCRRCVVVVFLRRRDTMTSIIAGLAQGVGIPFSLGLRSVHLILTLVGSLASNIRAHLGVAPVTHLTVSRTLAILEP